MRIPGDSKKMTIFNQDSGYLMVDLANAYQAAGYSVTLVTGRLKERDKPLNESIKLVFIKRYNRSSFLTRFGSWILATIQIFFMVMFQFRHGHLLFVSNPPIGAWVNLVLNREFSVLVYDVYPDALEEIGYANPRSWIYRIWACFNRKVYSKAKRIITISESMAETIGNYADDSKIEIIPIWTDNNFLRPISKESNPFLQQLGLQGKFIVMYSGNLGETANAEVMLKFAYDLRGYDHIVFIIIGEGSQKNQIAQKIVRDNLLNCRLLSWQSAEMFPYSLASADLALVSLNRSAGRIALPSKLYSLLSVGVPIVGLCDSNTELEKIIKRYDLGECFNFDQLNLVSDFVLRLSGDGELQEKLKTNVLAASKKYDSSNVLKFLV